MSYIKALATDLAYCGSKILWTNDPQDLHDCLSKMKDSIDEVLCMLEHECNIEPQTDSLTEAMQESYPCPDEGCPGMVTMEECSHCGEDYLDKLD